MAGVKKRLCAMGKCVLYGEVVLWLNTMGVSVLCREIVLFSEVPFPPYSLYIVWRCHVELFLTTHDIVIPPLGITNMRTGERLVFIFCSYNLKPTSQ